MNRLTATVLALAVGLAGLAPGCSSRKGSSTGEPTRRDELQEVGNMLRDFMGGANRGPASAGELARYESTFPFAYKPVKSGDIVIVWGAKMGGEGGGGSDGIIAFEKKVPAEGGLVLLANGTVKEMSAAEFKTAPKATK